jgi:ABC-2 type transport system permease protein
MTGAALDLSPAPGAAPRSRQLIAQTTMELRLMLRNGEQLLLTIIIPTVLLILFASAPIADLPKPRIDFLVPGVLALAVMSTAFTGQAIGTGFERRYGVLRRLGTTPLPRWVLLTSKTLSVLCVELLQVALLCVVGLAYGWSPHGNVLAVVGLLLLGTAAFSALGLLMAGTLRAEATLAAANLVYLVLLVLGGVAFPLTDFSPGVRHALDLLPIAALTDGLRIVLRSSGGAPLHNLPPLHDWLTLLVWTAVGGAAAAKWFRWD